MAIKTNYNFKGVEVKDAYIRIDRLWGSSRDGWTALVGVYTKTIKDIPAVEEVTEERLVTEATAEAEAVYETVVVVEAMEATQVEELNKIEEFNISASYENDERGYKTLYKALSVKFGGEKI